MQIELRFGDSTVMIADEFPEMGVVSPLTVGGVYSTLGITPTTSRRSGSGPLRQAPRSSSRSRTCSGAIAMARSSIPLPQVGARANRSETFPLRRSELPRQRCSEVRSGFYALVGDLRGWCHEVASVGPSYVVAETGAAPPARSFGLLQRRPTARS
jgi:hypothetical protein